jgi:hypothetical protein
MYPKISSNSLMFWSGCGSVLVSFVGPLMGMQMKVVNNIHSIGKFVLLPNINNCENELIVFLDVRYWGLLVAVSIAGIAYNFAIILGNKMIPPHLASMVFINHITKTKRITYLYFTFNYYSVLPVRCLGGPWRRCHRVPHLSTYTYDYWITRHYGRRH